jgi:U3 small nucleolar ribonucleoprotein component
MPKRSLTDEEKSSNMIDRKTNKFMKSVYAFLKKKTGVVEESWECSLMLLETYYRQFLELSEQIKDLESYFVESRGAYVPHPLLVARDKASIRLESMMKSCGITFKESAKLDIVETKTEDSPLESFLKNRK